MNGPPDKKRSPVSSHLDAERQRVVAAGGEPSDEEAEHLLECAACRDALDASEALAGAMQQLRATPALPLSRQQAVEERLQKTVARPRRRLLVAAALAPLALAAAWLLAPWAALPPPAPPPESHAATTTEGAGRLATLQAGQDELLALEGAATFRVRPLQPGHRFRVRMGADEIEVKGTTFRLESDAAGLREIAVTEGLVEVRTRCCGVHLVGAGQRWAASAPPAGSAAPEGSAAPGSVAPEGSAAPPARSAAPGASTGAAPGASTGGAASTGAAGGSAGSAPQESADELRRRGLAAFDGGQYGPAAALLQQAAALAPQAAWSRDARTLAGVARVLTTPAAAIPGLGVGVAAFDKAAQRAAGSGDAARAAAARLGAARSSKGEGRKTRFCALLGEAGLGAAARAEATRECGR